MKKASLLQLVLVLLLVSVQVPGAYADLGNKNFGTVDFVLDAHTSGPVRVGDLTNEKEPYPVTGGIWMYNDDNNDVDDNIYIIVRVWVKPYLGYSTKEIETADGSGIVDLTSDKTGDGKVDRYDLKSDGIWIEGLGNHYSTGKDESGYRWRVDSEYIGGSHYPSKWRRDDEFLVPSWEANIGPGGIMEGGMIEYRATIPIDRVEAETGHGSPWTIGFEVHASPTRLMPEWVIPEVPYGTIMSMTLIMLGLLFYIKRPF